MDHWDTANAHGPAMLFTHARGAGGLPILAETHQLVAAYLEHAPDLVPVADLVAQDPALCLHVMHAASQLTQPQPHPIAILEAVEVVGREGLADTLERVEVVRGLGDRSRLDLVQLRDHAVNVALLARFHARAAHENGDLAYLAGLLHDTGTLAVGRYLPESLRQLLDQSATHASLEATCAAHGFAPPLAWTIALLENLGIAPAVTRSLLALSCPTWPEQDPASGIRDAIYRAHRLCEERKGASVWDRLPHLQQLSGLDPFALPQAVGVTTGLGAGLH